MADSLVISNLIELLGGGVPSTVAQCIGAKFRLAPNFDLGAPNPVNDLIAQLTNDGSRPQGRRFDNRTFSADVVIIGTSRDNLAGAQELLQTTILQQQDFRLTYTRDGSSLPQVYRCFRATAATVAYSIPWQRSFLSKVTITFQALPFGRSDTAQTLTFSSAAAGSTPPPSPVLVDDYSVLGSGAHFSASTLGIVGAHSAHWDGSSGGFPTYTKTLGTPLDITGRQNLTFYCGLASPGFVYYEWAAGNVTFNLTLTDGTKTISMGLTQYCASSNTTGAPTWQLITAQVPQSVAGFNYAHITGYTISAYNFNNFQGKEMTPDTWFNDLVAVSTTAGVPASSRAQIYQLFGILGSARTPLNLQIQQPPVSIPQTVTLTPAAPTWLPPAGVTVIDTIEVMGAGGAGSSLTGTGTGGGGGGGGYAKRTAYPCTPGVVMTAVLPTGPAPGTSAADASFDLAGVAGGPGLVAHPGGSAPANSATAGTAGPATTGSGVTSFAGGAGAAGGTTGGGGGAAASSAGAGAAAVGQAGATGPSGDGGAGGAAGNNPGVSGTLPGGGGGGGHSTGTAEPGGSGAAAQAVVSYTQVMATFKTLIVHIPGPDAPANLSPFATVGNAVDPPDGREYTVPSLVAGTLADFGGTYGIILTNFSFNGSASRTVTVTVRQYEYLGGPSYPTVVSRTFVPTDIKNGIIDMEFMSLPGQYVAPDNATGFYTVAVTCTNTSDRYMDVLFIDTAGQMVKVNADTAVPNMWIDEPATTQDQGAVMASAFDRPSAISVLQKTDLSGGPPTVYPGNQVMMVWCLEGAPAAFANYYPAWLSERLN